MRGTLGDMGGCVRLRFRDFEGLGFGAVLRVLGLGLF